MNAEPLPDPYRGNHCWMKIKNHPSSPIADDRFCPKQGERYLLTKHAGMKVEMFLCFDHSEKMKKYGYTVTKAK